VIGAANERNLSSAGAIALASITCAYSKMRGVVPGVRQVRAKIPSNHLFLHPPWPVRAVLGKNWTHATDSNLSRDRFGAPIPRSRKEPHTILVNTYLALKRVNLVRCATRRSGPAFGTEPCPHPFSTRFPIDTRLAPCEGSAMSSARALFATAGLALASACASTPVFKIDV
jgi:hypothetical protein